VRLPQLADAEDYRELARELRVLAERCRFPRGQLELVQLAIKFEQRAERIEKNSRS
jgi:hypothetical protein